MRDVCRVPSALLRLAESDKSLYRAAGVSSACSVCCGDDVVIWRWKLRSALGEVDVSVVLTAAVVITAT